MPDPSIVAGDHVAILRTCRAIYDEAKPVLYKDTRFNLYCSWKDKHDHLDSATEAVEARYQKWLLDDWLRINHGESSDARSRRLQVARFNQIQQARSIKLIIKADGARELCSEGEWISHLPAAINSTSQLWKLHTILSSRKDEDLVNLQGEFEAAITLLGKIEPKGNVTSAMEMSISYAGLSSASYYALLDKVGW